MKTITKNVVLEIKKNVECPELGFIHYGKWGGSSREQRLMTNALCDDWLWRYEMLDDLVMKVHKAIEYIKKESYDGYFDMYGEQIEKLLEILKGNEK